MTPITALLLRLLQSYIAVTSLALGAGLLFPSTLVVLAPFGTLLLQAIFFLASLKIDLGEVRQAMRHPFRILLANLFMLVVFPLAAYPLARLVYPEAAVGVMLLAAMPTAMTAPLFASLAGGSESLALVLTVTTSLLAPITIPLAARMTVGSEVPIDVWAMFWNLAYVIFLPFALAQVARKALRARMKAASFTFKPASILLLGLLIAAVTAQNAPQILESLTGSVLRILLTLFVFFGVTHAIGYLTALHRTHAEQVTYAIALAYMSFVTAIYLAERFFPSPVTILTTVLAIVPWTLLFVPFRAWALQYDAGGRR